MMVGPLLYSNVLVNRHCQNECLKILVWNWKTIYPGFLHGLTGKETWWVCLIFIGWSNTSFCFSIKYAGSLKIADWLYLPVKSCVKFQRNETSFSRSFLMCHAFHKFWTVLWTKSSCVHWPSEVWFVDGHCCAVSAYSLGSSGVDLDRIEFLIVQSCPYFLDQRTWVFGSCFPEQIFDN